MRSRFGLALVLLGVSLWALRRTTSGVFWLLPPAVVQGVALLALFGCCLLVANACAAAWAALKRADL